MKRIARVAFIGTGIFGFLLISKWKELSKKGRSVFILLAVLPQLYRIYRKYINRFNVKCYIKPNELRNSYDFIVIGAGTSGSVVAVRLAESKELGYPKVLLLEAGDKAETSSLSTQIIPVTTGLNQKTDIDWTFKSIPQKGCNNREIFCPRGKVMGGSSVLNYMMWIRGNPTDWDNIGKGWSYQELLPFWKKCETLITDGTIKNTRGTEGPVEITYASKSFKIVEAFVKAGMQAGYKFIHDVNDGNNQIGVSYTQYNIDKLCRRRNAFISYMEYLQSTKAFKSGKIKLDILPKAHVTKIVCNNEQKEITATGVEFTCNSRQYYIQANKEVILSAGAFQSPQILMLSGFGDKKELNKHNIPVICDIPNIGKNLQDHPGTFLVLRKSKDHPYTNEITSNDTVFKNTLKYLFLGKGTLTTSQIDANIFCQLPLSNKVNGTHDYPDAQLLLGRGSETWDGTIIVGYITKQKSRGSVTLKSNNPFDPPLIDCGFYTDKDNYDINLACEMLYEMSRIAKQKAMRPLFYKESFIKPADGIDDEKKITDPLQFWDELENGEIYKDINKMKEYIRRTTGTIYHHSCTCQIGDTTKDIDAVVGLDLKLKYTNNLRVCDASVLKVVTTGNTQAPCYMLGEKLADIIIKQYSY